MKLVTIGDSITRGTYTAEGDSCPLHVANPNFSDLLKEKIGCEELKNYGINGVSISHTAPINCEYNMCNHIDNMEYGDIVLLCGGTNDQQGKVVIGNKEDKEDISFYGAVDIFFRKAKAKYSDKGAKVFVVLPIEKRYASATEDGRFALEDYRLVLEEKAKEYGFPVVDSRKLNFNPTDENFRKEYMLDGLHPNEKAHKLFAELIYNEIKKYL